MSGITKASANELIEGALAVVDHVGPIRRRSRLGGLLNYYCARGVMTREGEFNGSAHE